MQFSYVLSLIFAPALYLATAAPRGPETVFETEPCTHPSVRREWRSLSREERIDWIRSVKCLAALPHDDAIAPTVFPDFPPYKLPPQNTSASFYDDLSYVHMDLSTKMHFMGLWLPWHRLLLEGFERALKSKCGFKGTQPYWDWTLDAPDFEHGSIWDDDPESGFGSWGDVTGDYQIPAGAFAHDFVLSYPSPHTIRRNFTLRPYTTQRPEDGFPIPDLPANTTITLGEVNGMVAGYNGDFLGFSTHFDRNEGPRTAVHRMIGGDSAGTCPSSDAAAGCTTNPAMTANDPLFWYAQSAIYTF